MCSAFILLAVSLYLNSVLVNGQNINSPNNGYLSGPERTILEKIRKHNQTMQMMGQTLSSRIQSIKESYANATETFQTKYGGLSSAIDELSEKMNAVLDGLNGNIQYVVSQGECKSASVVCDCSEIKANGSLASGMYRLNVLHQQKRRYFFAYCDMTGNGSWTVFQRRKDGSENFFRGWSDYANGFGNPKEEFWLGNEFLYLLTSKRRYRLRIDMEDVHNIKRFTEYSTFRIASSADKYKLTANGYSGTAADGLRLDTGKKFTTKDSDNCEWIGNTAASSEGAWWYSSTARLSHLNGLYPDDLVWRDWFGGDYSKNYSLKAAEMKMSSVF